MDSDTSLRHKKEKLCSSCGHIGKPLIRNRGSIIIFIGLLFLLILPGVIYGLYLISGRVYKCRKCKAQTLIPLDSPIAQNILTSTRQTQSLESKVSNLGG